MRALQDWIRRRLSTDGGFILLESVIAITLITVIMSAVGVEYVSGLASTNHQRSEARAIQLADTAMENLRALDPSDLLLGRAAADVITERDTLAGISSVSPWINTTAANLAYDPSASSSTGAKVSPTPDTQTTPYQVWNYLDCYRASSDHTCQSTSSQGVNYIRAVVAVTWSQAGCVSDTCGYAMSSLINADADPEFDDNQTLPPAPQIQSPGDQNVEVGDHISLQLLVKDGTGVPPFFWSATGLPSGLSISPAGLITGTVTGSPGTVTSTVTVTDGFGSRTDTAQLVWNVLGQLKFANVANQTSLTTDSVNVNVTASGGKAPYTFTDPNSTLPSGLSISSNGSITGQPQAGVYTVKLLVTDSLGNHTATSNTFTWTVAYPPLVTSNPGTQTTTVNQAATAITLRAQGGSGTYTWSATGLPPGVSIAGNTISGTPTTKGTFNVTIKATDAVGNSNSQTFSWKVVAAPTVSSPAAQTDTAGGSVSVAVSSTCPNTPCSYTLNGGPPGLTVNSSGTINGTITGGAQTYTGITVTIKDASGATATSTPGFKWTVNASPSIATPSAVDATSKPSARISLNMANYVTNGTGPYTYTATGLPGYLTLNQSTGVISGTAPNSASTSPNTRVTVVDADGQSDTTTSFDWHISDLALSIGNFTQSKNSSFNLTLASYTSGGTAPYTFSASQLPPALTLSNGVISGTLTTKGTYSVVVTVTDQSGAAASSTTTIKVN